jgi:hypothetical protein
MPLPFALDHINLWLLRDHQDGQDGWTIVDCGINHEAIRGYWETIFANHLDGLPVLRVIVTHMHPDHIGLAHWLCQRWNVALWISATDYQVARMACLGDNGFGGERSAAYFAQHGLTDPDSVAKIRARTEAMFDAGWPSEALDLQVRGLLGPTAGMALGYAEAAACARGEVSRMQAVEAIVLATRQFARRQRTWWRKFPAVCMRPRGVGDGGYVEEAGAALGEG